MTFITDALRPSLGGIEERLEAITTSNRPAIVTARRAALALLFFVVIQLWAHLSVTEVVNGLSLGGLYGIIGVALVLTYRTSRIINFAAAAVGAVPAIVACLLSTSEHINYLVVAPIAIFGGLAFGALTDIFILRRFANASRLIVTVVTIGIAQSYAALGFFVPVWFGDRATGVPKVTTPWQNIAYHNSRGEPVLTGNVLAGLVVVVALTAFLAVFLKRSRLGIALRASSESAERAALLGIPVARVQTISWAFAGLLSSLAIFTQAPLIGVPSDATLGFDTLLYGLAAAVVAKMENVSVALVTGLGIGLLISTSVLQTGTNDYASALMLPLILVGLLLQRRSRSRAVESGASTWQTVSAFRPVPIELRTLSEVLRLRAIFILGALGLTIALPYLVSAPNMPALTILPIFGIIGVSLVVLTGWAGQISLGQFGLVGNSHRHRRRRGHRHGHRLAGRPHPGSLSCGDDARIRLRNAELRAQHQLLAGPASAAHWLYREHCPALSLRAVQSRRRQDVLLRLLHIPLAVSAHRCVLPPSAQRSHSHRFARQPAGSVVVLRRTGADTPRRIRDLGCLCRRRGCALHLLATQRHRRFVRRVQQRRCVPRRLDRRSGLTGRWDSRRDRVRGKRAVRT